MEEDNRLSPQERKRFEEIENTLQQAETTHYLTLGKGLGEVNSSRLYREEFTCFAEYCKQGWGMSKGTAHRFIKAAKVAQHLSEAGYSVPVSEYQARQLTRFLDEPEKLNEVWQAVLERDQPVTAKLIVEVAEKKFPTKESESRANEDSDEDSGNNAPSRSSASLAKDSNGTNEKKYAFSISTKAHPQAIADLRKRLQLPPGEKDQMGFGMLEGQEDASRVVKELVVWFENHNPANFSLEFKAKKPDSGRM